MALPVDWLMGFSSRISSCIVMVICVECGAPVKDVYKDFGRGNIRLTRCENCGGFADKYVEYEFMLIILDLLLHRAQVYRHILFNKIQARSSSSIAGIDIALLKLLPAYVFFDAYLYWFKLKSFYGSYQHLHYLADLPSKPYDRHFLLLGLSLLGFLVYTGGIMGVVWFLEHKYKTKFREGKVEYNYLFMTVLLSSFGKLTTILMMIWDYDINFGRVVNLFVLTSNITSIQVYLNSSGALAFLIVLFGFTVKCVFQLLAYFAMPSMRLFVL